MLKTREIPQYEDEPEDWPRFLYKASRGSIKAVEILSDASLAYMQALTGDPDSPSTMHADDYYTIFCSAFPKTPPLPCAQDVVDYATKTGWLLQPFTASSEYLLGKECCEDAWRRHVEIDEVSLFNDAVLTCLTRWDVDTVLAYTNIYDPDYDSRAVVAGMICLSLTWPEK